MINLCFLRDACHDASLGISVHQARDAGCRGDKITEHLLPLDVQAALYNALISPLFGYTDTMWGDRDDPQVFCLAQLCFI